MQGLRMDAVASGREADGMDVELDTTGLEDEKRRRDDAELLQAAMEELALERGDARAESSRRGVVVKETLVENPARMGAGAPRLVSASEAVEGYVPRAQRGILRRQKAEGEESDEEEDTDWQL
ncbi:hypothetical protein FH972_023797 [Carpinus fangiana]|uniref:Uncharacterized protein n=1 Tax=Carpinus fangiana TaxID=176857 RepID=A0A5N6KX03_9ROSI|nr:hypothetical protein FH972_023797 [Carpinus fangiana]